MSRFHTGLFDRIFGERVTIEVRSPEGRIVSRSVTKKWLEQMEAQRKIAAIDAVRVHLLDPATGYQVVMWRVGTDVPKDTVDKLKDPETDSLYAMAWYEQGQRKLAVVRKDKWDELRQESYS